MTQDKTLHTPLPSPTKRRRGRLISTLAVAVMVVSYANCGTENEILTTGNEALQSASSSQASVKWPCDGGKFYYGGPSLVQDEYCEWNRSSTTYGQPLVCTFYSNFYAENGPVLTSNLGNISSTKFNSWTCLTGNADGNGRAVGCGVGSGIIPECASGLTCAQSTCVPSRASDPAICKALNRLNSAGARVSIPSWGTHPVRLKPKASVANNCTSNEHGTVLTCSFQASPFTSCDAVAKEIEASAHLNVTL